MPALCNGMGGRSPLVCAGESVWPGMGWEVVFAGFVLGVVLLRCTSPTHGPKVAPYMFEIPKCIDLDAETTEKIGRNMYLKIIFFFFFLKLS